jgi:glycosyltransferase involved in cell wall biosynthesis
MASIPTQNKFEDLSVLVSCFNKEKFIPNFISKAIELRELGAELIVINDGSTDASADILNEFSSHLLIVHTENLGVASARNLALVAATRPYVLFLDIDDSLDLDSLAAGMAEIRSSGSDLVVSSYIRIQDESISHAPIDADLLAGTPIEGNHRFKILSGMGFWRYIYSQDFIRNNQLRFFPSFEEMGGDFFILDDYFWMLHLASIEKFELRLNKSDLPLYRYHYEIPQPPEKWNSFIRQVARFPDAYRVLEEVLANCKHDHNHEWLILAGREGLVRHLKYLDFIEFLGTTPELTRYILNSKIFFSERRFLSLLSLLSECGGRTLRNSFALFKKDFLAFVRREDIAIEVLS